MMNKQNSFMIWLSFVVRMTLFAVGLMWPAGTLKWWEAWVLVALWAIYGLVTTIYLLRHDPALLAPDPGAARQVLRVDGAADQRCGQVARGGRRRASLRALGT